MGERKLDRRLSGPRPTAAYARIGPVIYRQLICRFGSAEAALRAVPNLALGGDGKAPALCTRDQAEREVALIDIAPVPVDEIIRLSGAPSGTVQMSLLILDVAGRLDRHAGGKVSLRGA